MIRRASHADLPRIAEIRGAVRENRLRDPSRVTEADVLWFIEHPGLFVWEADGVVAGFAAADPRDGSVWALFMDVRFERQGIGRALFARAVQVLDDAGCTRQWLTTGPGTRAERFYRRAGWAVVGVKEGDLVLERQR